MSRLNSPPNILFKQRRNLFIIASGTACRNVVPCNLCCTRVVPLKCIYKMYRMLSTNMIVPRYPTSYLCHILNTETTCKKQMYNIMIRVIHAALPWDWYTLHSSSGLIYPNELGLTKKSLHMIKYLCGNRCLHHIITLRLHYLLHPHMYVCILNVHSVLCQNWNSIW